LGVPDIPGAVIDIDHTLNGLMVYSDEPSIAGTRHVIEMTANIMHSPSYLYFTVTVEFDLCEDADGSSCLSCQQSDLFPLNLSLDEKEFVW
jgi:hypothetical protein